MKKILSLLLVLVLVLGLCACGGGSKTPKEFSVGYGRVDITPKSSVSLHGYFELRDSIGVFNRLYATCIAMADSTGNTVLMYAVDLIYVNNSMAEKYVKQVSEATGIPESNITASGSHTHSAPTPNGNATYWETQFYPAMVQAAKDALADMAPAQILAGETRTDKMNFVRHYKTATGVIIGDNFGSASENGGITGHATEADNQMQLIRMVRADKKDILMINWQGHPKTASAGDTPEGQANRPLIASDYVGMLRDNLEAENEDLQVIYFLGPSGNLNVYSRMKDERANATSDPKTFGKNLTKYVTDALPTLQPVENTQPAVKNEKVKQETPQKGGASKAVCEVTTVVAGDISFVAVPYEMFDTNGMFVKENSPTKFTFLMTCANGHIGYVPSEYAYDYDGACYEVRSSILERGGAEDLANKMVEQLKTTAAK